jgi:hypothetical protein
MQRAQLFQNPMFIQNAGPVRTVLSLHAPVSAIGKRPLCRY